MSFRDFLHRVGHSYPGKVPALAARMGEREKVLQNKLNPNMDTHHMNEDDIELMLDLADANRRAAEFFAHKSNCVVIPLIDAESTDMELLDAFLNVVRDLGEFSGEFQRDWADGKIDQREFNRLTKDTDDVIAHLLELRERIGQLVR